MRILLKLVLFLALVAVAAFLGVAMFSDLPPPVREIEIPVAPQ